MSFLEVRNVTKQFGSLVAVSDVSLAVEQGELRAIIGPNGAGKTTFFNMISGFFPPTTGDIVLDGETVTRLPVADARRPRHGAHLPDHRDLPRAHRARERAHRRRGRGGSEPQALERRRRADARRARGR